MAGIDYNDERFTQVENDKKEALSNIEETYGGMIDQSDDYFKAQSDAAQKWADKQSQMQQEQTDFAIEQIEQQKAQAKQDYTKEQSGAYVDWQKQSDQYGANAEQMAANGLQNAGFSESSQVSMYNTYQNRVATARESYNRAILNYNNSIQEARLQNSSILAEIAYNALQKQLELSLQGFQYKNQLVLTLADKKMEIDRDYYSRYQDVLSQINTENAQAEQKRQFEAQMAENKRQFDLQMAEEKRQFNALHSSSGSSGGSSGGGGGSSSKKKSSGSSINKNKSSGSSSGSGSVNKSSSGSGKSTKKSSGNSIDMKSVLALGYGPISAAKLSSLVDQGIVEQYTSGGKTKFRKSAYALKQSMLFKG